jgi:putative nucleotidyltransferase with HDIG domain
MDVQGKDKLFVTQYIHNLRGGSQPILAQASDGLVYVVKFNNNLQGANLPFNESIANELYRACRLEVPSWKPLMLTDAFLDQNPSCWMQTPDGRLRPDSGICFGSRFLGGEGIRLLEILPGTSLKQVHNHEDFWLAWLIDSLAEHRDTDTADHVLRVARLSHEIARAMLRNGSCDSKLADSIGLASILHDVGKVGIADEILHKQGPLNCDERCTIQQHTTIGREILRKIQTLSPDSMYMQIAGDIAFGHHEWFNGQGYPTGAISTDIPLSARIVAVADVYDALTSWRPYKDPWPPEQTIGYILSLSAMQFCPDVIDAFMTVMSNWSSTPVLKWSEDLSTGYADIYAAQGKTTEARQFLLQAMSSGHFTVPNDPVWLGFGLIYEQCGVRDAAIGAY